MRAYSKKTCHILPCLILAIIFLLTSCSLRSDSQKLYVDIHSADTSSINGEYYVPYFPIVADGGEDAMVSIPRIWPEPDESTNDWKSGYDLYHLKDGTLTLLREKDGIVNLTAVDGDYYYWNQNGVFCFHPDSNPSDFLFALPEGRFFARFWGHDGTLYAIQYTQTKPTEARIYRYDIESEILESLPWFQNYYEQEQKRGRAYGFVGVVGDELLVFSNNERNELGYKYFWLNLTDGSTRPCGISGPPYGYRDGCLIVYDRFTGSYLFHDVQTGEESPFPIPEEVEAAGEGEFELLGVTEEAAYWRDGMSFYLQRDEEFRKVFSFSWERFFYDSTPFYQLNGDTYCFAFFGTPDEGYDLTDLSLHDPALEEGEKMRFAALTPDGKVYILAEAYYNPYWQDF